MAQAKQDPPADPSEAQSLDDFLCFAIYSTNLAVNRLNKPVLDKLGLTYLQYIVLVALYEQDDQTVGGLGDRLFLDSSTLTPLLKRLETTSNPATRSGRRAAGAGAPHSAADFHHLRERLVKLRTNLSDLVPEKA